MEGDRFTLFVTFGPSELGRVQTLGLTAHQLVSEAAHEQANHAQASGSGPANMALDLDLDIQEDCFQCAHQG